MVLLVHLTTHLLLGLASGHFPTLQGADCRQQEVKAERASSGLCATCPGSPLRTPRAPDSHLDLQQPYVLVIIQPAAA